MCNQLFVKKTVMCIILSKIVFKTHSKNNTPIKKGTGSSFTIFLRTEPILILLLIFYNVIMLYFRLDNC